MVDGDTSKAEQAQDAILDEIIKNASSSSTRILALAEAWALVDVSEPVARRRRGCVDQVTAQQKGRARRRLCRPGRPSFASSGGGCYWG